MGSTHHRQHAATTNAGYTDHLRKTLNGIQKKLKNWEKTKYVKHFLPNKNTSHGGNDN